MQTTAQKRDVYQIVTDRIIEELEKGCVPWKRPWTSAGLPQNLITRKPYRGINVWLLALCNYSQNYFLTFKQAQAIGAKVKKGEKSHLVIFWKWDEKKDPETEEIIKVPFIRYYMVYNIAQCENVPSSKIPPSEAQNDPILDCEQIIHEMPQGPPIKQVEDIPYYHPIHDYVNMPPMKNFLHSEAYYSTLFHELVHSTGHSSRLNRKELMQIKPFNSEMYSFEELVAEIGASYLNSLTGIAAREFEQNTAYIQGWLAKLKNDKRLIISASAQAQRATDFILDVKSKDKDDAEVPKEIKVPEIVST
jgi:antirestriction protein ArdC